MPLEKLSLPSKNMGNVADLPGFNPRLSHTKESKNGTWCCLVKHSEL